jgi:hypothetical protein
VLGLYGEPVVPVDVSVMERVMSLPRANQFVNWKPEGYEKLIEKLDNDRRKTV